MYAVIEKTTRAVLRTCNTKEAALVACQATSVIKCGSVVEPKVYFCTL